MAKRTSKTTEENKEQLKAVIDELKANRVQATEESVKLQTVLESFAEQTKKLVASIDKLSVKPKDVTKGFEGKGAAPEKKKVEKPEKKVGFGEASGKFLKENKSLLMGGAAAAFLMNPKLAIDVVTKLVSVGSNLATVIDKIGKADFAGTISAVGKAFTDNPIIMTGLAAFGAKKAINISKNIYDLGKGAANSIGKGLGTVTKVGDAAKGAITKVATNPSVVTGAGAALNTAKGVASSGLSKVASALPPSLVSNAGAALNTVKGVVGSGLAKVAGVVPEGIAGAATGALDKFKGAMGKIATLPGLKQVLKSIPGLGLILSLGSVANRISDGDYVGAGIDLAAGIAGLFPGFGTAAAVALTGVNYARDKMSDAEFAEELKGNQTSAEEKRLGLTKPKVESKPTEPPKKGEFYQKMYGTLYDQAVKAGVPNPEVVAHLGASQSTLETGSGKHLAGGNNYFGIKSHGKGGNTVATKEFIDGKEVTVNDKFRSYESMEQSAADYIKFLQDNPRYSKVLQATSVEEAIQLQGQTGYATAPTYSSGLMSVYKSAMSPKVAPADKPKTETAALQKDLDKTKAESDKSTKSIMFAQAGGGSSSSSVVNNNVTNVNRPDYTAKDMTSPMLFTM